MSNAGEGANDGLATWFLIMGYIVFVNQESFITLLDGITKGELIIISLIVGITLLWSLARFVALIISVIVYSATWAYNRISREYIQNAKVKLNEVIKVLQS